MQSKHVVIVAGEASGDQHASRLVSELKSLNHSIEFSGIGGVQMQAAGVELLHNLAQYGVTGLVEVLKHFCIIKQAFRDIQAHLIRYKPDLLILVDYPGFNLRLARYARRLNIKVLYYISPQIWAWKAKRIHRIQSDVNMMAVILPFEKPIYQQAGVPVRFVGHPLATSTQPTMTLAAAKVYFGLKQGTGSIIGLLPGSRKNEIQALLPVILATAAKLKQAHPELQFVLPVASSLAVCDIEAMLADNPLQIHCIASHPLDVINICHSVIVASGTASLEAALLKKPMAIIYRTHPLTYAIGKQLVKVKYLGLCNLLSHSMIVPELLQNDLTANHLFQVMDDFLTKPAIYQAAKKRLTELAYRLSKDKADCPLSQLVIELLYNNADTNSSQQYEKKQYFIK